MLHEQPRFYGNQTIYTPEFTLGYAVIDVNNRALKISIIIIAISETRSLKKYIYIQYSPDKSIYKLIRCISYFTFDLDFIFV